MPVPYPEVFRREAGTNEHGFSFKRAISLQVMALNWLHLRRPPVAPACISLGHPLSKLQWRLVRELEYQSRAWENKEVAAADMGRGASKVETLEQALSFLSSLDVGSGPREAVLSESVSGSDHTRKYFGVASGGREFARGLQRAFGGEVVEHAQTSGASLMFAKKIEVERLNFRGTPAFNPMPYLDAAGQKIYESPIDMASKPHEAVVDPPQVKIHASREQRAALFRKLDESDRLGLVGESEALAGYQSGLFSIVKDMETDRLIFDSRPFNTLERAPQRWVYSAASASNLCDIQLPADSVLVTSGTDLRDFYYAFRAGAQRTVRNTLKAYLTPNEAKQYKCYRKELDRERYIFPALRTLAMGDACAVELAQTAHVGLLVQANYLREDNMVSLKLPCPRSPSMLGVVIDDLVALEVLSKEVHMMGNPSQSALEVQEMLGHYTEAGLIPHEKKTFFDQTEAEFWGASVNGSEGLVRASLSRVIPICIVTHLVIKMQVVSLGLLEVLIGCWTSTFLFRRRLLSLLSTVYEPLQRGLSSRTIIRLSPALIEELLLILALAPLAVTSISACNSPFVYASDASDWGIGVTRARLPDGLQSEVHRHRLRKSYWVKLLTPLRKLQRLRGVLPASEELPDGQMLPSHPLWLALGGSLKFVEVLRKRAVKPTHINVLELRGLGKAEEIAAKEGFRRRVFVLADSQVGLGAWVKGRASSVALNAELQQTLPIHLGCNLQSFAGFLPSEYNSADGPSRNTSPQDPILEMPACFGSLPDLEEFDRWLEQYGADPYTVSGLPSIQELLPEESFAERRNRARETRSRVRVRALPEAAKPPRESRNARCTQSVSSSCSQSLSPRSQELLGRFPESQFVRSGSAALDQDWKPAGPGFLDLYSGKKGVAQAFADFSGTWVLTFEVLDSSTQDLRSTSLRKVIFELLEDDSLLGLGCAIFCSSFSRAIRPAWRSAFHPAGLPSLTGDAKSKVLEGNDHAEFVCQALEICRRRGLLYWVENPQTSHLWGLPGFVKLGSRQVCNLFRYDCCRFGRPWRKRTSILTNCHLQGYSVFCQGNHVHRRLCGYSKQHKCCWTRVAQEYPERLCRLLGYALAVDSGCLPHKRKITAASLARQTHGRIGEAKNPGPRRPKDFDHRNDVVLDKVQLVEPATAKLGSRSAQLFESWCVEVLGRETSRTLVECSATLALLLKLFGIHLFDSKHSLYVYRQLLAQYLRDRPSLRSHLGICWQLVSKWERVEPVEHRTPVPVVLLRAMVVLALLWGWPRWAAVTLLIFHGIARPGEVLKAYRSDVLLPADLVAEGSGFLYLTISAPKTRHRGGGRVQHTKISEPLVTKFCEVVFSSLQPQDRLFPGSPASYRRRWDALLRALEVPITLQLTPAGLRAGGAVYLYRQDIELQKLLWRMRLSSLQTLHHYVQEVGADSVFVRLPSHSRHLVVSTSSIFEVYLTWCTTRDGAVLRP